MIKKYLNLIKFKITLGNLFSVIGGFFLASKDKVNYILLAYTLLSMFFIIASSCMMNNYFDQDIDQKMQRTKNRITFNDSFSIKIFFFGAIFVLLGLSLLFYFINFITTCIASLAYINYILIYSLYMKRKSIYSTIVGSFSGASPPIIGYCAVANKIDIIVLVLLLMFIFWQIPHFYAIVISHYEDYELIELPILPVKKDLLITKHHIVLSIVGFIISTLMLSIIKFVKLNFLIVTFTINLFWLTLAIKGYFLNNNKSWSYTMFIFSIIVIITINLMILINFYN